jgi:hypothetical protein
MSNDFPTDLHADYEAAFTYPFSTHYWQSKRGRSHWVWMEGWQDCLAGPIRNIVKEGSCAYVYDRDDSYFAAVNDPATLYAYLKRNHQGLRDGVGRFTPTSRNEEIDLASMHRFATAIWAVAEKAIEIERNRWSAEHAPNARKLSKGVHE